MCMIIYFIICYLWRIYFISVCIILFCLFFQIQAWKSGERMCYFPVRWDHTEHTRHFVLSALLFLTVTYVYRHTTQSTNPHTSVNNVTWPIFLGFFTQNSNILTMLSDFFYCFWGIIQKICNKQWLSTFKSIKISVFDSVSFWWRHVVLPSPNWKTCWPNLKAFCFRHVLGAWEEHCIIHASCRSPL